jgi:integrase
MNALSPEQAALFIDATYISPFKAFFSLLLTSGMRPGEALGLKWSDIDYNGKKVTVNRSLTRTKCGGWTLEEPKTACSRRTIPLPASVIEDLREHKKKQSKKALATLDYKNQGFVFSASNFEPMNEVNVLNRHFKPILKKAGLPDIRLYDLRHTCATLLLSAGENSKVVSERLGHASIVLTLDTYSHVLPDMQQGASDKLEGLLFNVSYNK